MKKQTSSIFAAALVALGLLTGFTATGQNAAQDPRVTEFESLSTKIARNAATATDAEMIKTIDLGHALGRPYGASLAVRKYLAAKPSPSLPLLRKAIDNAVEVGDFQTAAARSKIYLQTAAPGPEASRVAATLYTAQLDYLDATDDTYRFMTDAGGRFRQDMQAKKFDKWYVDQAVRRRDCAGLAAHLTLVLGDKLPLEQEREYYWEALDWLINEVRTPVRSKFDAASDCRKLASLIRGDEKRKARMGFYAANLAFKAGAAGKEAQTLDKEFTSVTAAANAYFSKYVGAETLQDILYVFADSNPDYGWRRNQVEAKLDFFANAFGKLSDADRETLMEWDYRGYIATPARWSELGARHAALFKRSHATRHLHFVTSAQQNTYDLFKKQSVFLQGVPSRDAAIINALGASTNFNACLDHLVRSETWHAADAIDDTYAIVKHMWNVYASYPRGEKDKLPPDTYDRAMSRFGTVHVSPTPLAFNHELVSDVLRHSWRTLEDKSRMQPVLAAYDWVPFPPNARKAAFAGVYTEFKQWASEIRRSAKATEKEAATLRGKLQREKTELAEVTKELSDTTNASEWKTQRLKTSKERNEENIKQVTSEIAQIDARMKTEQAGLTAIDGLEKAFSRVQGLPGDPNKAPNEQAKLWARMVAARNSGNAGAFTAAARTLYAQVKEPHRTKRPFAQAALFLMLKPSQGAKAKAIDVFDLQCEVLTDQLTRWNPNGPNPQIRWVADTIMSSGHGWRWGYLSKGDRTKSLKLNGIFAAAVERHLGRGNWQQLLEWTMMTRRGRDWRETDTNKTLFEKIIKAGALPVKTLMSYVQSRDYFSVLSKAYPVATYFDDMWIAEARAAGHLDVGYHQHGGQDKNGKVRKYAAGVFGAMAVIPRGYGDDKPAYSRYELSHWYSQVMNADEATRNAFLDKVGAHYGTGRFDDVSMGRLGLTYSVNARTPEGRKLFFDGLTVYLDRVKKTPARPQLPGMIALSHIPENKPLTKPETDVLVRLLSDGCRPARCSINYGDHLVSQLHGSLLAQGRDADLFALIPHLWKVARDSGSPPLRKKLARTADQLAQDGKYELATVYSSTGLDLLGADLEEADRNLLTAVRSRSISQLGYVIPVERSDPRYAIFAAQEDYLAGNVQRGWHAYLAKKELFAETLNELDPAFVTWVINMHSQAGEFNEAESYARAMMTLMDKDDSGYSAETRGLIILTYADIAFHRLEYPRARALYGRIVAAKEFDGTRAQTDAKFRTVDVDRITGQFDEAMQSLDEILKDKSRYVQQEALYHTAQVKFDTGEPLEALDSLNRVFSLNPNHASARILEGRVNLALKDYEKARELRHVGESMDLNIIVPGKSLRITLSDENLSVVGQSSKIGIRVWTDSGDDEILVLTPFADSKTLFEGEIKTLLAPTFKGDKALQVLGQDDVHYDFSDDFKRQHGIDESVTHTLRVVSDSALYTSSGKILTSEEYEIQALEEQILARREDDSSEDVALSTVRVSDQVKPGNMINLRVDDPDRSTTAEKDRLVVTVATTSGDTIRAFPLVETEPHSGVFEAAVPTESAPATAFASDSLEGREPNFVISSGQYPAWVGLPDNERPKSFSVDLNEYADLGVLKIATREVGRKLKDFILQTSANGTDFETVAGWPVAAEPWDGSPLAVFMEKPKVENETKTTPSEGEIEILDAAAIDLALGNASWSRKRAVRPEAMSASWDATLFGKANELGIRTDERYLARFSAAFYVPRREVRTFKLKATGMGATFLLLVDGQAGTVLNEEEEEIVAPHEFTDALKKGVHRVDVYVDAAASSKPSFELLSDIDDEKTLGPCPSSMFGPAEAPQVAQAVQRTPAGVVPNEDASVLTVSFAEGTRARVLRLIIHDFETDAPAINSLTLNAPDGRAILPTMSDLMALRENERLEIVPGDRVSVTYEDPSCVDKENRIRESFLSATYANATVSPVFVEATEGDARYIPLRRFTPGDAVAVMINDPDLDASDKMDTAEFAVRTALSEPRTLKALETEEHTGIFVGRFFPVETTPQRSSEIKVGKEDEAVITYLDAENTDPGIGWERKATIEQAYFVDPELRVYNIESRLLTEEEMEREPAGSMAARTLDAIRPSKQAEGDVARSPLGGSVLVELLWPTIAKSPESEATLHVQTSSGREARGADLRQPYDVDVWDTIALSRPVSDTAAMAAPVGYTAGKVVGDRYAGTALDDGRFTFTINTALADPEDDETLLVRNTDDVFVGFRYVDDAGKTNWLTRRVDLFADAFFAIMDREYAEPVTGLYVGECAYFRVINMMQDSSDERDTLDVTLVCGDARKTITLTETLGHSGVFQGMCRFTYATGAEGELAELNAMPVTYGATVTATYAPGDDAAPLTHAIEIYKGSDGDIMPFTKRFRDPEMAVRTRLTVAEAYFELAKKHRKMKQQDLAERQIAEGKRLLEEALKDFPGTELRAQADYLLANLVLELAEETQDPQEKAKHFSAAVVQFSDIVANYRSSSYAPKAQFKKALALELMGDIDRASDEYVKLAYRWPDNELVPETIARLGEYFYTKGMGLVTESEKEGDEVTKEVLVLQSQEPFMTAGEVYSSLGERFPQHNLADKTTTLAGQCFMRAHSYEAAAKTFEQLIDKKDVDKDLMAEALYWCGDCYTKKENLDLKEAYRRFKRLDWDYPASKWAKFARGRLLGDDLAKFDTIKDDE